MQEPPVSEEWERLVEQLIKAAIQFIDDFKRMFWGDEEIADGDEDEQSS